MFVKAGVAAGIFAGILTMTVIKLPKWLAVPLMRIPSWAQSLLVHFGFGTWLGGLTGHTVAGFLSIPWYGISEYFLRPRILGLRRKSKIMRSMVG